MRPGSLKLELEGHFLPSLGLKVAPISFMKQKEAMAVSSLYKLFAGACLYCLVFSLASHADVIRTVVSGTEKKNCNIQLRIPRESTTPLPIFFLQNGSGLYSMEDEGRIPPNVRYLYNRSQIAILSMDKPGMSFEEDKVIEGEDYNRYTQDDLITCAENTLKWVSSERSVDSQRIFLIGHSEGAMVFSRLVAKFAVSNREMLRSIQMLSLSGVPLEGFKDLINRQIGDADLNKSFWTAYEKRDDATLKKMTSLPYSYWENILAQPSLRETFEELAESELDLSIQIFQGLADANTPAKNVMELERWNMTRAVNGSTAMPLSIRYYQAGHGLNLTAINDSIMIWKMYLGQ